MGKKKKTTEKIVTFYRGPKPPPTRVATDSEMRVIIDALTSCIASRNCAFKVGTSLLQLAIGLKSSLRCLKQGRTKAIIYGDSTPPHLAKHLQFDAAKAKLPIIQAPKLTELASNLKLTKLMIFSLVIPVPESDSKAPSSAESNLIENIIASEEFEKLYQLLSGSSSAVVERAIRFNSPVIDRVRSSGSSRAKKEAKNKGIDVHK